MSSYIARITCKKCGKELAKIEAYHDKPDMFYPQDIHDDEFRLPCEYCQDCLNGK